MNRVRAIAFATVIGVLAACASAPRPAPTELYFAVELSRQGHVVGRPKLIGETGKKVRAERRQPGAAEPDYRLVLDPVPDHQGYRIKLDVSVPQMAGHSELALFNGEERRIELGPNPGDLQVSLMVMEVDSPEFRALMNDGQATRAPGSI